MSTYSASLCVRGSCKLEISSNHLVNINTGICKLNIQIQHGHMILVIAEAQLVMSWVRPKADGKRGFDERGTF